MSSNGHLRCTHVQAIINSAVMNLGVHVFLSILVSLVCMPTSEIAMSYGGSVSSCFFFFKLISTLFSIVPVLVCSPTNSVKGFPFLHTISRIYCLYTFGQYSFWTVWHGTSLLVYLFYTWLTSFTSTSCWSDCLLFSIVYTCLPCQREVVHRCVALSLGILFCSIDLFLSLC